MTDFKHIKGSAFRCLYPECGALVHKSQIDSHLKWHADKEKASEIYQEAKKEYRAKTTSVKYQEENSWGHDGSTCSCMECNLRREMTGQ